MAPPGTERKKECKRWVWGLNNMVAGTGTVGGFTCQDSGPSNSGLQNVVIWLGGQRSVDDVE